MDINDLGYFKSDNGPLGIRNQIIEMKEEC